MSLRDDHRRSIRIKPALTSLSMDVPFIGQEKDKWCWAACVAMVWARYNLDIKVCHVASTALPMPSAVCCSAADDCNKTRNDCQITAIWEKFLIKANYVWGTITPQQIITEIQTNSRPIEMRLQPAPGQRGYSHVIIAYDYQPDGAGFKLLVRDPFNSATTSITSSELDDPKALRVWAATWINLTQPSREKVDHALQRNTGRDYAG